MEEGEEGPLKDLYVKVRTVVLSCYYYHSHHECIVFRRAHDG